MTCCITSWFFLMLFYIIGGRSGPKTPNLALNIREISSNSLGKHTKLEQYLKTNQFTLLFTCFKHTSEKRHLRYLNQEKPKNFLKNSSTTKKTTNTDHLTPTKYV